MKKKLFILSTVITLALSSSITVCAQPQIMPDGVVFDAEYYAQTNPDVVAVFGTDANMLYLHYTQYGKAEGRLSVSPNTDLIAITAQQTNATEGNHCPYPLNVVITETSEYGLEYDVIYTTIYGETYHSDIFGDFTVNKMYRLLEYCQEKGIPIENTKMGYTYQGGSGRDRVVDELYSATNIYEINEERLVAMFGKDALYSVLKPNDNGGAIITPLYSTHRVSPEAEKVGDYAEGTVYKYIQGTHYTIGGKYADKCELFEDKDKCIAGLVSIL